MTASAASRPRRVFFLVLVALLVAVAEVLARVAGAVLGPAQHIDVRPLRDVWADQTQQISLLLDDSTTLVERDTLLGWRYRPGYTSAVHRLNSAGHRASTEVSVLRDPGRRRIAAFGDSFVYGTEVTNAEAWSTRLQAAHADSLEVLNYGVGGYGTDQAFLLFLREGMRFSPDVVLIGFAPVNLSRIGNVYRRFISTDEVPVVKPRFELEPSGRLTLRPTPLRTREEWERLRRDPSSARALGAHDMWYDPLRYENPLYDWSAMVRLSTVVAVRGWRRYVWDGRLFEGEVFRPSAPSFALQRAVLEAFADSVTQRGATPAYVFFPDRDDIAAVRRGGVPVYATLRDSLARSRRVPIIDLADAFRAEAPTGGLEAWFAPGGHYSALGNDRVARWLAQHPVLAAGS